MLKQMLFKYQGQISAALVLGGMDINGPALYSIYPHGSVDKLPYVTMGSGSLAAMGVFEDGFKPDMTKEEGCELVRQAIRAGIFNDLGYVTLRYVLCLCLCLCLLFATGLASSRGCNATHCRGGIAAVHRGPVPAETCAPRRCLTRVKRKWLACVHLQNVLTSELSPVDDVGQVWFECGHMRYY